MAILACIARPVQIADADPTALDRQYAAMTSPFADECHTDEPTPADALLDGTDHEDEDDGLDLGDRWNTLPPSDDLDARWCLSHAGGGSGLPLDDLDLLPTLRRSSAIRLDPDEGAHACGLA